MNKEKIICNFRWTIFAFWMLGLVFFILFGLGEINNIFGVFAIIFALCVGLVSFFFKNFIVKPDMRENRPVEGDSKVVKFLERFYSPVFGSWFWIMFTLVCVNVFVKESCEPEPREVLILLFPVYLGVLVSFLNKKRIISLLFWR